MTRPAEGEMLVVFAIQNEPIWIWEAFRITVSRSHDGHYRLALSDFLSAKIDIFTSDAAGVLAWAFVPQQLLHGGGNEIALVQQPLKLVAVSHQGVQAAADEIRRRLLSTHHRYNAIRDNLLLG